MKTLRPDLPRIPTSMRSLPIFRGYPVPWFVAQIDGEPDFRVVDGPKIKQALADGLCWLCGRRIARGDRLAFVVGPMCAVNRISSEPPSHVECARFAVQACPFLVRPYAVRREGDLPDGHREPAGQMLRRNPGVSLVWITRRFYVERVDSGLLFTMGKPVKVECWREGRAATLEEVRESIDTGLPALEETAAAQGGGARLALAIELEKARRLLGVA